MKITPSTIIQRDSKLITSKMDGETVMMSINNGEYYGLDPIGSRIWELIENPISVESLIAKLRCEYDIEIAQCEHDTTIFLQQMANKNLLIIS